MANNILNTLKDIFAEVLLCSKEKLNLNTPYRDFGVDSLLIPQIVQLIHTKIGSAISASDLYNFISIHDIAKYLEQGISDGFSNHSTAWNKMPIAQNKKEQNNQVLVKLSLEFPYKEVISNGIQWLAFGETPYIKPLIFLPPLNTLAPIWIQQLRFFLRTKQYQIFIPHYPGHGKSSYKATTLEQIAQDILEGFKEISNNYTQFDLIGWSMGGSLSVLIAFLAPNQVNKIVLTNTAAPLQVNIFTKSTYLKSELASGIDYLTSLYQDNQINIVKYIKAHCSLDILTHYVEQLQNFYVMDKLRNLTQKCLIIHGTTDPVIKKEDINNLRIIPNSKVIEINQQGHFLPLTTPFQFNKLVKSFLESERS